MVYAAPPLRERALMPGRCGDDEALLAGVVRGDGGGDVLTSNPPPRSCRGVSVVYGCAYQGMMNTYRLPRR